MAEEGKAGVPDPRMGSNWGTIIQPPFEMGFQKVDREAVIGISERLHTTETKVLNVVVRYKSVRNNRVTKNIKNCISETILLVW